jgi:hypothetical protein
VFEIMEVTRKVNLEENKSDCFPTDPSCVPDCHPGGGSCNPDCNPRSG